MKAQVRVPSSIAVCFVLSVLAGHVRAAGFVEDSKASLTMRNYYFDRDYKGTSAQSAAREWAQGFILKYSSGFTQGPVGFGIDAVGLLGVKLDSSPDRTGTGLLPYDVPSREPRDDYSELGLTGKMKISKTELQAGTISTFLPIAFASPTRLLPQTFRGAYLRSQDLDNLTLNAGWLDRINLRDSTSYQKMTVASPNGRFNPAAESDRFVFLGGDYKWSDSLTLKYYHAVLDEMYRKDYFGFEQIQPIGPGKLKTDVRYFITGEDGAAKAGHVDNRNLGMMFTYSVGAHSLGAGYMQLNGATAMPYLTGTEPLVVSEGSLSSEFLNPKERSWQVRYDYDFAGVAVPGLKGMVRYLEGSNIQLPTALGGDGLSESEKDVELSYVVQSGTFKGVSLRLRHAWYRNDFAPAASFRDDNETRVNIDYTLALW
ncbi:OprD family porin [Pseudomonas sp. P5_109]|uniref:OprD family porin n=1 Tax=Pseudomonas sp. P5_109 TaxID=3043441 RepID=UPI002A365767|nr:OprD family porin [Pseudomonas sp. P5_109]WPN32310.1 OprD family porin [Pseudomonas sp. P5_109]